MERVTVAVTESSRREGLQSRGRTDVDVGKHSFRFVPVRSGNRDVDLFPCTVGEREQIDGGTKKITRTEQSWEQTVLGGHGG